MNLLPAIDLMNGQCVRLQKGDFASRKVYRDDPVAVARELERLGVRWLHMVDLDGARDGKSRQKSVVESIAKQTTLQVQYGGGIRSAREIEDLREAGVARIVLGSVAVTQPEFTAEMLKVHGGECITLALDILGGDDLTVASHGWQTSSGSSLWELMECYREHGLKHVLCTDISRDGMMAGPNFDLYLTMRKHSPDLNIMASGGIRSMQDLRQLETIKVAGAVIGKAFYEGSIDLEKAVEIFSSGKDSSCEDWSTELR